MMPFLHWPGRLLSLLGKDNPATRAIVWYLGGARAVWTPRDYTHLMREGFEQQGTVYAAVMLMAKAFTSIPFVLYERSRVAGGNPQEITTHPLLDLLNDPNDEQGTGAFKQAVFAYLKLSGNSYLALVGPDPAKIGADRGPPHRLWPLRPDRMKVLPDPAQRIGGYVYAKDTPGERRFERDRQGNLPIIHHKLFAATDDWYGLSPISAAAKAIDASSAALEWNVSLLQHQARPSGALVAKGNLTNPQFDRLKAELKENYSGAMNAGMPLVLDGELDWKEMSLNPKDLDWLMGLKQADRWIARVFHIAPELLGDADGKTFANVQEARKALYEEAVLPDAQMILEDWNSRLVPRWGNDRLYLAMNLDAVPALRDNQDALYARIEANHSLSLNEKRQALGYSPIIDYDVITLANGLVLVLDTDAPQGQPRIKEILGPPTLLPLDSTLPILPEEDEEPGNVRRLPSAAAGD